MLLGLVVVTNQTSAAWTQHVERVNGALKLVLPLCCAVTIACILGVRSLSGLGSAPTPVLGSLDP